MKTARKTFLDLVVKRKYAFTFTEPILGSSPLDKELYSKYVASKAPKLKETSENKNVEDEVDIIEEEERGITGFFRDENNYIYFMDYQIRGFIKKAANTLKDIVNIKALKSKISSFLFVFPRKVFIQKEIDGQLERPLRGMTAKGERISLAASEMVKEGVTILIEIHLLPHKELSWDIIEQLFDYGVYEGISQWRSASYGRFTWERIK